GVTFTALFQIIIVRFTRLASGNFTLLTDGMQLVFALLLVGLGLIIAIKSIRTLFFEKGAKEQKAAA
ncbi:MAG: carbon starvation protein A, partial [Sphaerochaeta sp.]